MLDITLILNGMSKAAVAAAAVLGAALLAGCAATSAPAAATSPTVSASPTPSRTAIQGALATCGIPESMAKVADGGHTATLHWGLASDSLSASDVGCILHAAGMPSSVGQQIDATRALDGMQRGSWAAFKATWTYHPDHGANLILTDQ